MRSAIVAPAGYERFTVGRATVVARVAAVAGLQAALQQAPSLHEWAAQVPDATPFQGRATAWGVRLPRASIDVVVRHARRGGLLKRLRGDRYVWPGRAPWELEASLRLQEAGVRTADVIAYALYEAGPGFCRCDVVTKRLPAGADFPQTWAEAQEPEREDLLIAVGSLLRDLRAAGARHADLNAKNLHMAREGGRWHAWVLDIDRVGFVAPNDPEVGQRNFDRLGRSIRKWRDRGLIAMTDGTLDRLSALAEGRA